MSSLPEHERALAAARRLGERDERIRAVLLKGSLARGEGDELSDLDLLIVAEPGRREELWEDRERLAAALGEPLGLFREAPWQAPYTAIALYDGPLKVDLFLHDGRVEPEPWLLGSVAGIHDPHGVLDDLLRALDAWQPPPFGVAQLEELDAHAWDWSWWAHVKLRRGMRWLAYFELALFAEHIVLHAHNVLAGAPWAGGHDAERRLDPAMLEALERALPQDAGGDELRRSLLALVELYWDARGRLAERLGVELDDRLAAQVRARLNAAA